MNNQYPIKYSNASHEHLLTLNLENKAVILFISTDHVKHGFEKLIKLLAHVKTAKEYLIIYAEDIPYEWFNQVNDIYRYEPPTEEQFLRIDQFLKENHELEVVASCGAGTSRSGFVHFYLDLIQDNLQDVFFKNSRNVYSKGDNVFNENTYRANSTLVHYAKKHMTHEQLLNLSKIKQN